MPASWIISFFALAAPPGDSSLPEPRFEKGMEIPFTGTIVDESKRPGQLFRNEYDLSVRWLVLETSDQRTDLAILTSITPKTDPKILAAAFNISGEAAANARTSARVDLVRWGADGTVRQLAIPTTPPPFSLPAEHRTHPLAHAPLSGPAFFEWGPLPPQQTGRDDGERDWKRGADETWNGSRVLDLFSVTKSKNFDNLDLAVTGWRRIDRLQISPTDGLPRAYARSIEQREGKSIISIVTTHLEKKPNVPAGDPVAMRNLRREAEMAAFYIAEWERWQSGGRKLEPNGAKILRARVERYLAEQHPRTSFRAAIDAMTRQIQE
ncbi:MAG: hypothetical protein U0798_05385 [Gemmataceae bacterium]